MAHNRISEPEAVARRARYQPRHAKAERPDICQQHPYDGLAVAVMALPCLDDERRWGWRAQHPGLDRPRQHRASL